MPPNTEFTAEKILNAVESTVGLLVQRAVRVYSFSHLTFQEYLAARHVFKKQSLLEHVSDSVGDLRWREFWLLLTAMLDPDDIFSKLEGYVHGLIRGNKEITAHLQRCSEKVTGTTNLESSMRVRALSVARERALDIVADLAVAPRTREGRDRLLASALELSEALDAPQSQRQARIVELAVFLNRVFGGERAIATDLARALALDLTENDLPWVDGQDRYPVLELLKGLFASLPEKPDTQWWQEAWPSWRSRMSEAGEVQSGRPRLSADAVTRLTQYCRATMLSLECLASARRVSGKTRNEMLGNMLRPL